MVAISDACRSGKHFWCMDAAYDKDTSSTTSCACSCHKIKEVDDGEI